MSPWSAPSTMAYMLQPTSIISLFYAYLVSMLMSLHGPIWHTAVLTLYSCTNLIQLEMYHIVSIANLEHLVCLH